jgi:hypothetical protein
MKHLLHCIRHDAGLMALTLLIGAVVAIEAVLAFWGPESTLVNEYRQVLARAPVEPAPDLLVMGDSVARGSILTSVLHEHLGKGVTIRNDAMQGTGPETAYFALKRMIAAGRIPGAILYAPSPHTFASTRMHIVAGGLCTWPEMADLLGSGHDRFDILGSTLLRFSYTLRYREQIAELLRGRREVLALFRPAVLNEDERVASAEKQAADRKPTAATPAPLKPLFRIPFTVAPVNRYYLDRFLNLAARHKIPIYWVTTPCTQRGYDSREKFGFNADYYRFLDQLATRPQVTVLQREFPVYADTDTSDQTHFDLPASRRFSAELGRRLQTAWPGR